MKLFKQIFIAEFSKVQNTFAIVLLVVVAASVPAFVAVEYLNHSDKVMIGIGINPWTAGWKRTNIGIGMFAGPCLIVMLSALLMNVEHKQNAWKYLLALPVPRGFIYINKLIVYVVLIFVFYITSVLVFLLCGIAIGWLIPESRFLTVWPEFFDICRLLVKSFTACLAIMAIHFWISFRVKNMFVNMVFGLMMIFFAMASYQAMDHIWYFPYNYGEMTVFKIAQGGFYFAKHEVASLVFFIVVSCMGYFDFVRKFKG